MTRLLLAAAFAVLPVAARAGEPAVRLAVRPQAAPEPALKYTLLPEVRDLTPGNPVQWYVRLFAEQRNFFFNKGAVAERERYRALPLAELPAEQLRDYGGSALRQADWAARLETPDWNALDRVRAEGLDLRLPELGPLRVLGEALQVKLRGAVAGRRYGDAIRHAQTMLAFARHLGEHPTTAANLLGISVADLALDALEEMVQQPGCPNLYWALTELPCPVVELRKGVQGDRVRADAELRPVRDDAAMTDAEVEEVIARLSGRLGFEREQSGRPPRGLRAELAALLKDADRVRAIRNRLVATGSSDALVAKFPAAQLVLLDEKRRYEIRRDEELKLLPLAPWQIGALAAGKRTEPAGLFDELLPRVVEARRAQGRLEQRVALLRHVEAIRLYAAGHGGNPPAKLADIGVPLPADPFTGQPFRYEAGGGTVRLSGGKPGSEFAARYEVTIR